jgi:hypothetical protein
VRWRQAGGRVGAIARDEVVVSMMSVVTGADVRGGRRAFARGERRRRGLERVTPGHREGRTRSSVDTPPSPRGPHHAPARSRV